MTGRQETLPDTFNLAPSSWQENVGKGGAEGRLWIEGSKLADIIDSVRLRVGLLDHNNTVSDV